jgi:MFS family permease
VLTFSAARTLTRDGRLLFCTRFVRLFAYGFLSVVLALYLDELGFSERQIGLLLTATLAGDAVISIGIATIADRVGRRHMLLFGTGLMVWPCDLHAHPNTALLVVAAVIGTISPSGTRSAHFYPLSRRCCPRRSRTGSGPRSSPGTTWSARSRRRSVR